MLGLLVITAAVVAMCIMGYVANADFGKGVDNFANTVVGVMDDVLKEIRDVMSKFKLASTLIGVPDYGAEYLATIERDMTNVHSEVTDTRALVREVNRYRELGLNVIFGWSLFMAVLTFFGGLFRWKGFLNVFIALGYLALLLVWLMFAVHFPVSIVVGDLCRAVVSYINDRQACETRNSARISKDENELEDCSSSAVTPLAKSINEVVPCSATSQSNDLEEAMWKTGSKALYMLTISGTNNGEPDHPGDLSIRGILEECDYLNWVDVGKYRPAGSYTIRNSTVYGTTHYPPRAPYQNLSDPEVVEHLIEFIQGCADIPLLNFTNQLRGFSLLWTAAQQVFDLTSCQYVFTSAKKIQDRVCIESLQGLDLIVGAFAALGFLFWFAEIYAVLGQKRFHKFPKQVSQVVGGARGQNPRKDQALVQFVM